MEAAQKLSDRINPEDLHKVLDAFAKRYSPAPETLGLGYTWTVQQIECATDIMFKQPGDLEPLYDEIIRTAIFTVKPDNIATFLGQRITYNCKKEIGTNYNQRILGTRIKHHRKRVPFSVNLPVRAMACRTDFACWEESQTLLKTLSLPTTPHRAVLTEF